MPFTRTLSGNKGTSLVEILVTMVVLLVGIMTVIQMFPTGFRVVRGSESETIATKLAERELERWKNAPDQLPTGILAVKDDGATVLNDQDPGPPLEGFVKDGDSWVRGNVLNIRKISGETTRIPVGTYFQAGSAVAMYGGRYTLAFGPIEVGVDPNNSSLFSGLSIKSADLRRRKGDRDTYPPFLRLGEYAVNYETETVGGKPAFHVAFPRVGAPMPMPTYYVSFSYWAEKDGELELLSSETSVDLSNGGAVTDYDGDWRPVQIDLPPGYSFVEVEEDTDTCARAFVQVAGGSWNPNDPYEFALADPILGVISFNPVGHGMYEYTASGLRPIEARIDYLVYDLRIIREDRVVPAPADGADQIPVKLSLRFILDLGDPTDNPNEERYEGLAPGLDVRVPLLMIDLSTGLRVDMTNVDIDFSVGQVILPLEANLLDWSGAVVAENEKLTGKHLRFFYRADGDWTVQCQKAYARYIPEHGTTQVDYRHFKQVARSNRLLFAPCEYGKTVSVDYTYIGSDGTERKVVGESHRIGNDPINGDYRIDLRPPGGGTINRIYAVVGTTFKVRVIWRDGRSWRHVDVETNLTRNSAR